VSANTDRSASLDANAPVNQPEEALTSESSRRSIVSMMESNYGVLMRLVRRKLRDRELAADLVNEAMAISLEQVRSGKLAKTDQGIAGYVFKVSMNLLRNHRRNKNNAVDARIDASALDKLAIPPERDDSDDQRIKQLTREMLESLNMARDRTIVERFYLDEEDKESICRDLGVTPAQFNLVISRARQRMRRLLDTRGLDKTDLLCLALSLCLAGTSYLLQPLVSPAAGIVTSFLCAACR
jgi:RNA polymerase sigma-70 factor (ECF subfamily)